jgi:hypothetical protein
MDLRIALDLPPGWTAAGEKALGLNPEAPCRIESRTSPALPVIPQRSVADGSAFCVDSAGQRARSGHNRPEMALLMKGTGCLAAAIFSPSVTVSESCLSR